MPKLAFSFLLLFSSVIAQQSFNPTSGRDVILKMHEMYKGRWYGNLTFRQQSNFFKDGVIDRQETWYEAFKAPGGLVIKFDSKESGSGIVFHHDSLFVFRNDTLLQRVRRVHDLLVLGFDVYVDDPSTTMKRLEEAGDNLEPCSVEKDSMGTFYVIGDEEHGRFWIDAKRLLFVKMRRNDPRGNLVEVQFNKYARVGGGWIAPEVVMLRNGQIVMKEEYSDWSVEKKLPASIFDLSKFRTTTW
jgi:hypothetical protein